MQLALGSVLKLTLSAFGGLGSFRAPSIRGALPVLLGGLLCVVGSTAMAQDRLTTSFVSTPKGGPATNPGSVYIIGDTVTVAIDYDEALGNVGTPTLTLNLDDDERDATCGRGSNTSQLLCSYVIREGDAAATSITVGVDALSGAGSLPARNNAAATHRPVGGEAVTVDGERLVVSSITIEGATTGFKAGDAITVGFNFGAGEVVRNPRDLGAAIVLSNAERSANFHSASADNEIDFRYRVVSGDNAQKLRVKLTNTDVLLDKNGNTGVADLADLNTKFAGEQVRRVDTRGPQLSRIRFLPPSGGRDPSVPYKTDDNIEFEVNFDEELADVPGTGVSLRVTVGTIDRPADCDDTGENTDGDEKIKCTLHVASGWEDTNGLSVPANPLNFGNLIKDDLGNVAVQTFSTEQFQEVRIDSVAPTIQRVTLGTIPRVIGGNVVVQVTFSETVVVPVASTVNLSVGGELRPADYIRTTNRVAEYRYSMTRDDLVGVANEESTERTVEVVEDAGNWITEVIRDAAGNDTITRFASLPTRTYKTVARVEGDTDGENDKVPNSALDRTAPRLQGVYLSGSTTVYGLGSSLSYQVVFSEPVTTSNATLELTIGSGSTQKKSPRIPLEGTEVAFPVSFNITDTDAFGNGRVTSARVILAEGGKIVDRGDGGDGGNGWFENEEDAKTAKESAPAGTPDYKTSKSPSAGISGALQGTRATIDTTRPTIKSVALLANPGPSARADDTRPYYGAGDVVWVDVTMSEDVSVSGTPVLKMDVSGAASDDTKDAKYRFARGKRNLIFEYKVLEGQVDRGGIGVHNADHVGFGDTGSDLIRDGAQNTCAAPAGSSFCGFSDWAGTASASHGVDGTIPSGDQTVPQTTDPAGPQVQTVSPVGSAVVRSTTPTGGYYKSGDTIRIEVPLSPAVTFTSAPQLLLDLDEGRAGRITAEGSFSSSGTPRTNLVFNYTVQSGDQDVNGFTGSLSGGGTLSVEDGKRVSLGGITISSSVKIDALAPELDSLRITSSAGSDGTYTVGDNIVVSATFSEEVERQGTSDPSVPILVGDVTRTATLQSPSSTSGGDTWVFSYKVAAGDNDADGVAIAANALKGALEDAAGNPATITHSAVSASTSHKVDTQGPSVTAVAVTGAGDNNLFLEGETITATVTFDEEVDVARTGTNAVRVRFNIGTEQRTATYDGGDGTETLTFTYVVADGDTGQISLPADALQGEVEDAAGNEAEGTLALSGGPYTVDASAPMLVEAPSITSSPPNGGDTYAVDDTITLQVRFDEPVMVTGEPRLPMQVGPKLRNIVVYTSGSGTDTLTFSYTVRNGDNDDNGVSVAANALRLPSGVTIQDVNGLTAAIEHGALPDQPGHKVDAIAPGIESVAITSTPDSEDAYLIDETIEVTVTFSEDIATDGTPTLDLMVGEGARAAACAQGSAGTQLTCSYTVVANDFDPDGISVDENMLEGTITDMVGNPAMLTHEALVDDPAHKVYAAAPEAVRTIDRLSLAAGGGTNSLDLTGIFTGFQLSYAAETSNANVATATVSGTDLTVVSGMEGTARVTVTASNLAGEASASFDVLVATDPVETAVLNDALAAIGRSMLSSTASVIGSRFELASTGSQMALGGSRFGGSLSPQMQRFLAGNDPFALEERLGERALFSGSGSQQAYGGGYGLTADRLLTGTSFNMPLNAMGTGDAQFAVWGAGDLQSFEGEPDNGMYDGSSSSGYIGVDARGDGWLAGVSVSRSGAEADYDFDGTAQVTGVRGGGTLETSVTAFHPYARLEVGADSEVWVIGGFGGGEADLSRTHVSGSQSSDLSMAMAVGGLRRALAMEFGGADLSLRGDAGFLSLETDSGMMAVDGLSASVSRLRLGLEAAWEGESATPFVEVSGRFDGGDGQTGGGLELAGGLRILNPESGFGLEAKGRILAMHTGDGYSESGIGVTASFEPGAAGRGITFRLSPRWGGSADSTDLFWDEVGNVRDASQYAYGLDRSQTWGVDAALGYGFGLRSMPGVVTPFGQMDVTGDQDQRIRVGVRYGLMQGLLGGTQVELSAERVDGEMHRVGETRVLVSGRARF